MTKLLLQDITRELSDKQGITPKQADTFSKMMFDILKEGLTSDGIVKIKGLGTFKLVAVEPRESVNVNTGGRVVIEGHSKVNFVPENALKELINKPFSQFETVVLNPGVDFSEIDSMVGTLEDIDTNPFDAVSAEPKEMEKVSAAIEEDKMPIQLDAAIAQEDNQNENLNVVDDDEHVEALVQLAEDDEVNESLADDDGMNEGGEKSENAQDIERIPITAPTEEDGKSGSDLPDTVEMESVPSNVEPIPSSEESESSVVKSESSDNMTTETKTDSINAVQDKSENYQLDESEEDDEKSDSENKPNKFLKTFVIVVIVLAVIAVCFVVGYIVGQQLAEKNTDRVENQVEAKQKEAKPVKDKVAKVAPMTKSSRTKAKPMQTKMIPKEKPTQTVKLDKGTVPSATVSQPAKFDSDKYDRQNNQVRTGAYRIVGVNKVIRLKKGETLKHFAEFNFGSREMVCYILAINEISSEQQLKPGQEVKIPKLELRRHKKR